MRRGVIAGGILVAVLARAGGFLLIRGLDMDGAGGRNAPHSPGPASPAAAERATVVWVNDGDTMLVRLRESATPTKLSGSREERVRLIGIDAPEMRPRPECFARESTRALVRLAPKGSVVTLEADRENRDHYGRALRYVRNESGELLNAAQVREGAAFALRVRPNVAQWDTMQALESEARNRRRGLWGACPNPRRPSHPSR